MYMLLTSEFCFDFIKTAYKLPGDGGTYCKTPCSVGEALDSDLDGLYNQRRRLLVTWNSNERTLKRPHDVCSVNLSHVVGVPWDARYHTG